MPSTSDVHASNDLRTRWREYQQENPNTYARNAAADLGVSEAELLATGCGDHVTRLRGSWRALLGELETLGPVMALTRNDAAVHEKTGLYQNTKFPEDSHVGLVLDDDIDLRLFLNHWHYGFAVEQETKAGMRHALQFFDAAGTAVHKVYLTRKSDREAYDRLVQKYRHDDQSPEQTVSAESDADSDEASTVSKTDAENFLEAWAELEDTHDFFPLLRDYDIGRTEALELAEGRFTTPVPAEALRFTLQAARDGEVPIMVFVGNKGCLQIHSGPVKKLKETGPWYNVLDPGFNMHLNETMIDRAWVVEKPTSDGTVTSLELYDADGWPIARFFGKRKPGIPEREDWRAILDDLRA